MKKLLTPLLLCLLGPTVSLAQHTLAGNLTVQQTVKLTGTITPSTITSGVNDYAPTGFSTAAVVRLLADAPRTVTGLAGGAAGRMVWLTNVGTQTITLATESASSTSANRFALGALPFDLMAGNSVSIWYDGTSARWRAGAPVATGGGTAVDQTARDAAAAAQATADSKQDALANASTLAKVTEAAGLPLWDGAAWPGDGTGTVTSVSVTTANGVSGTVATATTTPAITIDLGAITPTSVAATGNVTGSNLSGTNTGDQTSVTGNAGTATALQTARLINGVSFDGTANITVPAVDQTARDAAAAAQITANAAETPIGAQAKADAALADAIQRANHTGTQAATTITQDSTHRFATDAEKTAWNAKQDAITGGATTITTANLTVSRALASDTNGKVAVSSVTSTELGYVSGVTSGIQTQITNITPAEYYAGTMTVNIGTLIAGTVASLQAVGGTDVDIQEASSTGLQVQLDATTVSRISSVSVYGYYAGGSGHQIVVEFWNWTGSAWETVGTFGTTAAKQWYAFPLNNSVAYLSGTNARMRFRHVGTGITSHHLFLDKVAFSYGAPAGVGVANASSLAFIPTGDIAANNVQAAIGEVDAEKQPLDSDLTSIAALTTATFGRSLLTQADAAATRTTIGAGTSSFDGAYSSLSGIPQGLATTATPQFGKLGINQAADTNYALSVNGPFQIHRNPLAAGPVSVGDVYLSYPDGAVGRLVMDVFGSGPSMIFRRANGTAEAKTATVSGDSLLFYSARGYGTSAYSNNNGFWTVSAAENWTNTAQGVYHAWAGTNLGSASAIEWMRLQDGKMSLGGVGPTAQLHTTGTVRFAGFGAGTLVTDSSGNVTASSDRRLKNVSGKFTRGLDAIMQIQPKVFTWKPESGMNTEDVNVGFIAQDVQDVIPEAVGTMKTRDVEEEDAQTGKKTKHTKREAAESLTLSDRPIIAALVNAVKELKAKNDGLEARIAKLEKAK